MSVKAPVVDALGLRKWVDQRTTVHFPVVLIERPDRRAGMAPGSGRVVPPGRRLPGKRVHGARSWGTGPAGPGGLLDGLQPQGEVTGLGPARGVPGNLDRPQEPEPGQQLVGVRPQRGRPGVVSQHVVEELADDRNLSAALVEQHERPQRIPALPDPADPGNLQYRNIPDPDVQLCLPRADALQRHAMTADSSRHAESRPRLQQG